MSVVITLDDIRAYAEVDYIINHMNEKYREMVPEKMRRFFSEYKDPNHEVKVDPYVPLQKQGLKRYTLEILALFHLKYWCEAFKMASPRIVGLGPEPLPALAGGGVH